MVVTGDTTKRARALAGHVSRMCLSVAAREAPAGATRARRGRRALASPGVVDGFGLSAVHRKLEGERERGLREPPMEAQQPAAAPAPAMSWSDLANWNVAPDDLPPPPPPPPKGSRGASAVPQLGGEDCMDPACADPMCAPLAKRVKGQPRASEMDATKARLQEAMLGMAKDNKADEIRELCSKGELDAAYGNSIGQTALHIAGIWNAVEAGEVLLDHGALIDAKNDLSGATRACLPDVCPLLV